MEVNFTGNYVILYDLCCCVAVFPEIKYFFLERSYLRLWLSEKEVKHCILQGKPIKIQEVSNSKDPESD